MTNLIILLTLVTILVITLIVVKYCDSICSDSCTTETEEGFRNYGNYQNYSMKSRAQKIHDFNERRCDEGRFYVNCHACGRERVVQELYGEKPKCNMCKYGTNPTKKYCIDDCKIRANDTMSFYNKNYIDTDQIFCYNCLL